MNEEAKEKTALDVGGPWSFAKWNEGGSGFGLLDRDGETLGITIETNETIEMFQTRQWPRDLVIAKGTLAAAAPKLLKALENIVALELHGQTDNEPSEIYAAARAEIANAKGETT